ncbi:kelch repeat-containing protein, partial [Clostridium sp.]|uniref:Kelch repeat-containing protein n=1 Tax=Clostridium sp. TaxID=1506 RepID=UPI0026225F98
MLTVDMVFVFVFLFERKVGDFTNDSKRSKPGVGVVDDKIFVFGGFGDWQWLKTIEVYSEKTKRWEMMKVTMKTRRSYMGVAVIGDLIFIIWWLE